MVAGLTASPQEVGEALTMTGFMMDSFEEIKWLNKTDYLIGLEVRQNRGDCLSVFGIAKEVAAYYGLPLELPTAPNWGVKDNGFVNISVKATEQVKRILAVRISNVVNKESPEWLKEFLAHYDINSVSLLVDISNYVMIMTGYASHLFDFSLVNGELNWLINHEEQKITTLDKTTINLTGGELIIEDRENVLALAGIVGCSHAAIERITTDIIVEMAVYDRSVIKKNSRSLGITTEASNRLSKDMSLETANLAFQFLIGTIIDNTGGQIETKVYDYYPNKEKAKTIEFNPSLPSTLSGIELSHKKVNQILKNLYFTIDKKNDSNWLITPSIERLDIESAEDIVEEVLRLNRYDTIAFDNSPKIEIYPDITPDSWFIKEKIRDFLIANSFDEILSQPLVSEKINKEINWSSHDMVITQNSVNDEFPALRQSIGTGLLLQIKEYRKKNVFPLAIFEIGKIFNKKEFEIIETESLGIAKIGGNELSLKEFQLSVEKLLANLGVSLVEYEKLPIKNEAFNQDSAWLIVSGEAILGVIAKFKPLAKDVKAYFAEIDITKLIDLTKRFIDEPLATVELTNKLVSLDANIELSKELPIKSYIIEAEKIIAENLWSLSVVDEFVLEDSIRYTLRAVYCGLSDQAAKTKHLEIFSLK